MLKLAQDLNKIVALLHKGDLVAFPTETVYALAGDARNALSIKKIFDLKNRPLTQPLSVLLPENYDLESWVVSVPPIARRLAKHFWPGPLTLVFNRSGIVLPLELTGGQPTIGLRVPKHSTAQAILQKFGAGLAATSANLSTGLSATLAKHVRREFGNQVEIVDDGVCTEGIESTIVEVTTNFPKILRQGAISLRELKKIVDTEFIVDISNSERPIKVPLQQVVSAMLPNVILNYLKERKSVAVLARNASVLTYNNLIWVDMPQDPNDYAKLFYYYLHEFEQAGVSNILIEALPNSEKWETLHSLINSRIIKS